MKKIVGAIIGVFCLVSAVCICSTDIFAGENYSMQFNGSSFYLFSGEKSSFTLNTENAGDYDRLVWEVYNGEDELTAEEGFYSTSGKTITFSSSNTSTLYNVLALDEGDWDTIDVVVKAYNGSTLLCSTTQEIIFATKYCFMDDYQIPAEIIKGETISLSKKTTVSICDSKHPQGVDVEGKITSIKSSNSKVISVGSSNGKYTLTGKGSLETYANLTVKYSYTLNGTTYSKSEVFSEVYVVNSRYDVDLYAEPNFIVFGGTSSLIAEGEHIYLKNGNIYREDASSLTYRLNKVENDDITDIESQTSTNSWTIKAQNKPKSWNSGDTMTDEYYVEVLEDGISVCDSYPIEIEVCEEFYDIIVVDGSRNLNIATDGPFEAKELANVYLYNEAHPNGINCNGENDTTDLNSKLTFKSYNSGLFTLTENKLQFASASSVADYLSDYSRASIEFDVDDEDVCIKDYVCSYNLSCSHDMSHEADLIKATLTTDGKSAVYVCNACGRYYEDEAGTDEVIARETIYKVASIALSSTSYTYTGTAHIPTVTVKNSKGTKLVKDTDYTVTYYEASDILCESPITSPIETGSYKAVIKGIGNYDYTTSKTFAITKAAKTVNPSAKSLTTYVDKTPATITGSPIDGAEITCKVTKGGAYASVEKNEETGTWKVIGKKAGTATITITAAETANYKSATATVKVTVKSPLDISSGKYVTVGKAVWNGSELNPTVAIKNGKTTYATSNYNVSYEVVDANKQATTDWEPGNYVKVTIDAGNPDKKVLRGVCTKYVLIAKATQTATASVASTIYYGNDKDGNSKPAIQINHSNVLEEAEKTYSSSNKKYATVDTEGNITPKAAGKVTITVNYKATDHYAAKTVKLTVTVKKAVSLSNGKLVTVTAKYNGGNEVVPVVSVKGYKFGTDYTVDYDASGVTNAGQTLDVTITAVDKGGCLDSYKKTVTVAKADPSITVTGKPSSIKAKASKIITVGASNAAESPTITVTSANKTYLTATEDEETPTEWILKGIKVYSKSIKVTVKTSATANYNAKTYTFNVKVVK